MKHRCVVITVLSHDVVASMLRVCMIINSIHFLCCQIMALTLALAKDELQNLSLFAYILCAFIKTYSCIVNMTVFKKDIVEYS